jgi:two-component system chemotaxis response regulator CheY
MKGADMPWGLHTKDTPGKGRILIVDDEKNIRDLIRMTLTKAGYDVLEAEDGAKAVEILRKDDNPLMVDVITCDIRMPKVNGIEAIAFFRKEFPSIPVVVITGFPETEMAVSLLKQGVSDYVPKPVESQKLLAVVAKAMEQRIALKG